MLKSWFKKQFSDGREKRLYDDEIAWFKNGRYHRDGNLPAVISLNEYQEWWTNGKFVQDNSDAYEDNI